MDFKASLFMLTLLLVTEFSVQDVIGDVNKTATAFGDVVYALIGLVANLTNSNVTNVLGHNSVTELSVQDLIGNINETAKSIGDVVYALIGVAANLTNGNVANVYRPSLSPNRSPGEISKTKCAEYAKYAFTTSNENEKKYYCDLETGSSDTDITDIDASRKEFPHMVHIGHELEDGHVDYICAGSLISETYVLTVANCLENSTRVPPKMARLGVTDVDDTEHRQELKIAEIITFPDTNKLYHDIALVKLEKPVEINAYVRPACLNTERNFPYKEAIVSGWGLNGYGELRKHLAKGIVTISTTEQCNKTYGGEVNRQRLYQGIVEDWMICAAIKSGQDSCQGDSGGPLQVPIKDSEDLKCMYSIIGLTSFGKFCGDPDVPSVYTRVSHYINWIEDVVWPVV